MKSGLVLLTTVLSCSAWGQTYTISTFAGGGLPVGIPGTSASLAAGSTQCIAVDRAGNLFFVDQSSVLRLDAATGLLTLVAGNGTTGFSGDNGPATSAQLNGPSGVAVDSAGNLYIADAVNNRIRKVTNGAITTVAGNGTPDFGGDNGPATSAELNGPRGVAVDSAGNLYIADTVNNRIRKVANGVITTVAGGGLSLGDNGPATSAYLRAPSGVAVDSAGNLYIADTNNNRVREVANGAITTVAGDGNDVFCGDNGPATSACVFNPLGVAVDSAGNLYIADSGNDRVRKVTGGTITTVAGGGLSLGDNGPATSAAVDPFGIVLDSAGDLYIADFGANRIRKVSGGIITTVAGGGMVSFSGDNGPATSAELSNPDAVALDSAGNLYIADGLNYRLREVSNGVITTVAGNGTPGFSGDNGPATSAQLQPSGVAVDSAGNLYIADSNNCRVRKVSNGVITTVAGDGTPGFGGDNGPATSAWLFYPGGLAVDSAGNLYIADSANFRIRRISNGVITTVAGNGTQGFSGDNGPATSAQLNGPSGVAVDSAGNLYIADYLNNRVRKVSNGVITTVAGNGTQGFSGDNGPATSAQLQYPGGIAVDSAGSLYIADTYNNRVRKVSNGVITTVAGNGTQGYSGDNGPATSAELYYPYGVAVDSAGNVYIVDVGNNRIRLLTPQSPIIKSVVNAASFIGGPISPGELVTIFGSGIGPAAAAGATTDPATGKLATDIGGVQVLFNGTAAPMIYASSTQVSAAVPYEMAPVANPAAWIEYAGGTSNAYQLSLAATAPGLFAQNASGSGPGAILNQDNSLNGPGNAAAKGSIVRVYMTGEGPTNPQGITGAITAATLPPPQVTPAPVLPVGVLINGQPALWTYAGEAPGMVAGVMQLNVQIPANAASGALPIQVSIGGNMSQSGITVAVQ
jgi:uncharacterized protein (TIGR03437 family)